jgi:hypothetical protein
MRFTQRLARLAAACRPRLPQHRPPRADRPAPSGVLRGARALALAAIALLVAAASVASFMESYRALYDWAHGHGLSVRWAAVWPLQIDTFIAVGELALFIALVDGWQRRARILPWVVTLAGLAVSVAGNVGHVGWAAPVADKATAAVPPLAAAAALAVGLGVLKRVVEHRHPGTVPEPGTPVPALSSGLNGHGEAAAELFATELARGEVPGVRRIRREMHIGQPRASQVRDYLAEVATTSDQQGR